MSHLFPVLNQKRDIRKVWKLFLDWFLPAASLNNPVLFVHSGVCGSASFLSPEAVDIKRKEEPCMVIRFSSLSAGKLIKCLVACRTQDMLPDFLPTDLVRQRHKIKQNSNKKTLPMTRAAISNPLKMCAYCSHTYTEHFPPFPPLRMCS